MADDDDLIPKYEEEVRRLREMLEEFKRERRQTRWVPLVGAVLSVPTVLWKPWAPLLAFACALVVMGTWRYLIYGHVNERSFQLGLALKELRKLRADQAKVEAAGTTSSPT
jgi:hypothetical protein